MLSNYKNVWIVNYFKTSANEISIRSKQNFEPMAPISGSQLSRTMGNIIYIYLAV